MNFNLDFETDCIFILHAIIQRVLKENAKFYCALIDYERAFGTVIRDALWFKLLDNGISSKFTRMLRSLYNKVLAAVTLRKHAHIIYSNFFRSKIDNFQKKIFDIFLIFAQNIDYGYTLEPPRRGGSNEYPQSMFWSKNNKNRYTPAYPSFTIYKWGSRGYTFHGHVFLMKCSRRFPTFLKLHSE